MCPSNDTFTKVKNIDVGTGAPQQRQSTRDKANISNPKVNRGCVPLTSNRTSADCVQISLGPSIPYYSTEGLPYLGIQRYGMSRHL